MKDFYKTFTAIGWILLIISVIQIFLLPIFIFPLPILYIPTAIVFVIAALIKKMETAFPSYLNNDKESVIYNLKIVSYLLYIAAALPLILGIYNYMNLDHAPSFFGSLINILGLALTIISVIALFIAGFVLKLLNYGTRNVHAYAVGYTVYQDSEYSGDYNDETDYQEESEN
ncbi:hypothetical protein [Methanimicrococcus blatticola]|uniref:Uncharacterized protein n=1 Tax=Methanimicrococcus blatticola TaxID=91560 RepID=A0A484F4L3_9EURY|nr:hypothetical protein [Methanimicrococcus blatticola]MBZ3936069.1 hypothetical protein [Methanimicrococcus blatticola]MCC2509320.1 hypothetical protein [Methanimicrococcus blatticola]TDQ68205.1 hypothetical protein C7391_1143 [Methanimicrococcus blatticola]